jgi:hypothetical protein
VSISSVSGGSIANGITAQEVDFSSISSAAFEEAIRPGARHIASVGLFFFGPATNGVARPRHPSPGELLPRFVERYCAVVGCHPEVEGHDPSCHPSSSCRSRPGAAGKASFRHGPKVRCAARAALICFNRHQACPLVPIPSFGASVASPGQPFTGARRHARCATRMTAISRLVPNNWAPI